MAISESLSKRVEEGLQNADPSIFRKDNPFSLGMEEWFRDSDNVFQAPKSKNSVSFCSGKEAKGKSV